MTAGLTLVTGAGGFIGRHLVRRLVAAGVRVRASDRVAPGAAELPAGVEFVAADLARRDDLPPLFAGGIERVFHLGAICNFSTPYAALHPINVLGVERMTRLALAHEVRCFVHVSSTSVYGPYRGVPFREDAPREPQDAYGQSKRAGEDVVFRAIARGLPAIVARPCTVYGPGCTDGAGKAFSRPTAIPVIPGRGTQRLANVRVEDVAAALVHLAARPDAIGQAFNLCDASAPTLAEALTLAARTFGTRPPTLRLPLPAVALLARVDGAVARRRHRLPALEADAVRYLAADYAVDAGKLARTGFTLAFPDFAASMRGLAAAPKVIA